MQIEIIGDYEAAYRSDGEPALVLHHVVRGFDAVRLDAASVAMLRELLAIEQKRIRELGTYRLIFGAGGDVAFYTTAGQRTCYLNPDQAARLLRLLDA